MSSDRSDSVSESESSLASSEEESTDVEETPANGDGSLPDAPENQEYVSVHFSKNPRAKPPKTKVLANVYKFTTGKNIETETEIDLGKDKITELSELRKAVNRVDVSEDIKKNMLRLIDKATIGNIGEEKRIFVKNPRVVLMVTPEDIEQSTRSDLEVTKAYTSTNFTSSSLKIKNRDPLHFQIDVGNQHKEYKDAKAGNDAEDSLSPWVLEQVAPLIHLKQTPLIVKHAKEFTMDDGTLAYEVANKNSRIEHKNPFKIASDTDKFEDNEIEFLRQKLQGGDYSDMTDVYFYILRPIPDETKTQYVVDVLSNEIDQGATPRSDALELRQTNLELAQMGVGVPDLLMVDADVNMTPDQKSKAFKDIMDEVFYLKKQKLPDDLQTMYDSLLETYLNTYSNISNKNDDPINSATVEEFRKNRRKLNETANTKELEEKENEFAQALVDRELASSNVIDDVVRIFRELPSTFSENGEYNQKSKVYYRGLNTLPWKMFELEKVSHTKLNEKLKELKIKNLQSAKPEEKIKVVYANSGGNTPPPKFNGKIWMMWTELELAPIGKDEIAERLREKMATADDAVKVYRLLMKDDPADWENFVTFLTTEDKEAFIEKLVPDKKSAEVIASRLLKYRENSILNLFNRSLLVGEPIPKLEGRNLITQAALALLGDLPLESQWARKKMGVKAITDKRYSIPQPAAITN